jgi:hypothetical protein
MYQDQPGSAGDEDVPQICFIGDFDEVLTCMDAEVSQHAGTVATGTPDAGNINEPDTTGNPDGQQESELVGSGDPWDPEYTSTERMNHTGNRERQRDHSGTGSTKKPEAIQITEVIEDSGIGNTQKGEHH